MSEPVDAKYSVVLFQGPAPPNGLGEMTETELYGYLRTRAGENKTEAALSKLELLGSATVEFDDSLGLKSRVEIRRRHPK